MKIIKCHIENFGKLSDKTFDFTEGCNVFCEENGWGKSTLSTFIKVMFYGFDGETKKKLIEKEREIYRPWQGGVYGGQITFETGGHTYTMLRTFGKKEAEDEFVLKDETTNLVTDKYSSRIGEELFKIDAESFKRTVYISQNDCTTMTTDSINAKIGNLAENTDDINNYENVDNKLKDILNSMAPRRATGSLNKLKKQISELTEEVKEVDSVDKSIEEVSMRREADKEKLVSLKRHRDELATAQSKLSVSKDMQVKREKYNTLNEEYNVRLNEYESEKTYFTNGLPDETSLKNAMDSASRLEGLNQSARIYELSAEESIKYENNYREEFEDKESIDKEISHIQFIANSRNEKKSMLSMKRMELNNRQTILVNNKSKNIFDIVLFILAGFMLVLGVALVAISVPVVIVGVIIGIGVICGIAGFIIKNKKDKNVDETEDELIIKIRNEIEEDEKFVTDSGNEIKLFFEKYAISYNENDISAQLYEFKNLIKDCGVIREKLAKYNQAKEMFEKESAKVNSFIRNAGFTPMENANEQLMQMYAKYQKVVICENELKKALKAKEEFEENENVTEIMKSIEDEIPGAKSIEEITEELNNIHQQMEVINENISSYNKTLDDYRIKRDDISDKEVELEKLKTEYEEGVKRYTLIERTKELLNEAKTSFTAKYMQPIMSGFEKYYKMIARSEAEEFSIDANTRLSVNELGLPRDINSLSTGCQDMIGVCMRMALVDAMYKDEKPFVIFDDPFVNLDEAKTAGGVDFLKEIAREYQVIYFTCHKSRI